MIKVGNRVRNIRVEVYKDEPIVVIDIYDNKRYHIAENRDEKLSEIL